MTFPAEAGVTVAQDIMIIITALTIVVMGWGLLPKFWRRRKTRR